MSRIDILAVIATLIEGQLPKVGGPSSLFIDIFGVWRRTARRAVWVSAAAATSAEASAAAAAHPTTVTVNESTAPPPAAPAMTSSQSSAVARLKELKSLQKQGLITEAQYQEESQKLLNQIAE